jgi:carbon starvation protein
MGSVLIAAGAFVAYLVAYQTYGRFIGRRIFGLDRLRTTPAEGLHDGHDYVPTKPQILFGHHFTSIAGTGPIVGPAIAVIWGWVPALLWVIFGSIFMGAVHDLGSLVVSARHQGRTIGEVAADLISPRVGIIFLAVTALVLLIVVAVFCFVIASVFDAYPQSVLPIWLQIPIAVAMGHLVYRKGMNPLPLSIVAVVLMYVTIVIGAYIPLKMPEEAGLSPLTLWTLILLVYCYIASVLPVWRLLQPRDYINGHQLFIALGLLALGVLVAKPQIVAPAVDLHPAGAPPIWPMLFVIVACGAISGFHSLVASGTTAKQLASEAHAQAIGYGGMLLEGMLAVFVLIAVAAGVGLTAKGDMTGAAVWKARYASWQTAEGLSANLQAFVDGSGAMLASLHIPPKVALAIMGVFVTSFAATTLDTATRLQRYVISELAARVNLRPLTHKHAATSLAVGTAAAMALAQGGGRGGLILWPLFGATNQLLACLALLVITVYLQRQNKPLAFTFIPWLFMLLMTGWAMYYNMRGFWAGGPQQLHLLIIGGLVIALEAWMVIESLGVLIRRRQPARVPALG